MHYDAKKNASEERLCAFPWEQAGCLPPLRGGVGVGMSILCTGVDFSISRCLSSFRYELLTIHEICLLWSTGFSCQIPTNLRLGIWEKK